MNDLSPAAIRPSNHLLTMTENNTLLGRCTVALDEAISTINYPPHTMRARRAGVAAVLDHLAAEIAVMLERAPNLTAHQLITILRLGGPVTLRDGEDWCTWLPDGDRVISMYGVGGHTPHTRNRMEGRVQISLEVALRQVQTHLEYGWIMDARGKGAV